MTLRRNSMKGTTECQLERKRYMTKLFLMKEKIYHQDQVIRFSFVSFVSQIFPLVYYFQFGRVNFFISAKLLFFQVQKWFFKCHGNHFELILHFWKYKCLVLGSNETIVQGDIIIVNRGEENRLFTMTGLTKRSKHGKNKAAQKDVIRDANRYWDTTTIPYLVWPLLRKYINISKNICYVIEQRHIQNPVTHLTCFALRHGDSPVNLLHIFRTPFHKKSPGGLLL